MSNMAKFPNENDLDQQLLYAFSNKIMYALRNCLKAGANVNILIDGISLLHKAILNSDYVMALELIKYNINLNAQVKMFALIHRYEGILTPLHLALYETDFRFTRILMENNANTNIYTHDGLAAIHIAVINNVVQNLRYILHKADVNYPALHSNYKGWTALHLAIYLNNTSMVNVLLDCNADIASKAENGLIPLQLIKDNEMMKVIFNHNRFQNQIANIFHYLAERGVNFNAKIYPAVKSLFLLAHEFDCYEAIQHMKLLGATQENTPQWNFNTLHLSLSGMSI